MECTTPSAAAAPKAPGILVTFVFMFALGFVELSLRAAQIPPKQDGVAAERLAAGQEAGAGRVPQNVGPDELAGMVVDAQGKPLEGVEVDAWTWYPGNETRTDAQGWFRLRGLGKNAKIEVKFRKQDYTPQLFVTQPTGRPDWVVVLGNTTFFEGKVMSPGGEPVANALIRANQGPKRAEGVMISEIWTEARTDSEGRYRMYAQADAYDIQVRVPGVGAARLERTTIATDEAKRLDIALGPGVIFRAKTVDSVTGKPVSGVRLWHWQHKDVEGKSGEDGLVTIADMLPGPFSLMVECHDYARWWSEQASSEWARRQILPGRNGGPGWQRNFDNLDFDLSPGMKTVTITLEPAVKINGQVLDPAGKPVAGATVAPALTGTGNSLTGDTRFSVETDAKGHYEMALPASGDREYNLVAHDGKYGQWRRLGQRRHAVVRRQAGRAACHGAQVGPASACPRRVLDKSGKPVADREVRRQRRRPARKPLLRPDGHDGSRRHV